MDQLLTETAAEPTPEQVRAFHRKFVTGVTIVTATDGERPRGLALNAFSSVTVSPATVLVCVNKTSSTHDVLFSARTFAVNLLSRDQLPIAKRFAAKSDDKFSGLGWHTGEHGNPIIDDACAHLEAEISMRVRTSTHTVFFGRVLSAHSTEAQPLIYLGSHFYDSAGLEELQG